MYRIQYTSFSNSLANSLMYFCRYSIVLSSFLEMIIFCISFIVNALAFGYGIDLVKSKEMEFQNVFKSVIVKNECVDSMSYFSFIEYSM